MKYNLLKSDFFCCCSINYCSYRLFDQEDQHHETSNDKPNMINSTFCERSSLNFSQHLNRRPVCRAMLIQLLHHLRVERVQLSHETKVYVGSWGIRSIYYIDTFSILPLRMEYSPSNCNKNENRPANEIEEFFEKKKVCK